MYKYIYFAVCLSVCIINVRTAETIGPKFCVGPHMILGQVYGCSKLQKLCLKFLNFWLKFKNAWKIIIKPANFYCFCFILYKEKKLSAHW